MKNDLRYVCVHCGNDDDTLYDVGLSTEPEARITCLCGECKKDFDNCFDLWNKLIERRRFQNQAFNAIADYKLLDRKAQHGCINHRCDECDAVLSRMVKE